MDYEKIKLRTDEDLYVGNLTNKEGELVGYNIFVIPKRKESVPRKDYEALLSTIFNKEAKETKELSKGHVSMDNVEQIDVKLS